MIGCRRRTSTPAHAASFQCQAFTIHRMEIDVNQLPIPDWGLTCPCCRYALVGLPTHRCPECGTHLDMSAIIQPWHRLREPRYTGDERPIPNWDIHCQRCDTRLDGRESFECPGCGAPTDGESLKPRREWFLIEKQTCGELPLAGVQSLLAAEYVPFTYATDKALRAIYGGTDIIGSRLLVPREFYFDVLSLIHEAEQTLGHVRDHPAEGWTCPKCNEDVPAHFDVCWNCEYERRN